MKSSIINIGDELLIGQVVNTNAAYMSQALTSAGIAVGEVCTVGDDAAAIEHAVRRTVSDSDVVLVTGGLGPTKDDITKTVLCRMFGSELCENPDALANVERLFAQRGIALTDTNRRQALVPRCCEVINNDLGTAPCMWFDIGSQWLNEGNQLISNSCRKVLVALPGVPFEMEYLMSCKIIPLLRERFEMGCIVCKNIILQGIGESFLSDMLESVESAMPQNIKLAYLPQAGMIKLRLTATGDSHDSLQDAVGRCVRDIHAVASDYIVGEDFESIPDIVADLFVRRALTLATAESCTGGRIASLLTAKPGASRYFKGGVVSYCNEIKHDMLGVQQTTLDKFTAVSEETAREMAEGVRNRFGTGYGIATTGVAGPSGGSDGVPVGTVWVAVASPTGTNAKKMFYTGRRQQIIDRAVNEVLAMLVRNINTFTH